MLPDEVPPGTDPPPPPTLDGPTATAAGRGRIPDALACPAGTAPIREANSGAATAASTVKDPDAEPEPDPAWLELSRAAGLRTGISSSGGGAISAGRKGAKAAHTSAGV